MDSNDRWNANSFGNNRTAIYSRGKHARRAVDSHIESQDRHIAEWVGDLYVAAIFCGHGIGGGYCAARCIPRLKVVLENPFLRARFAASPEEAMAELFWLLDLDAKEAHKSPPSKATIADEFGALEFVLSDDKTEYRCVNRENWESCEVDFGCSAVISVLVNDTIVTGNVGDAGALLIGTDEDPTILSTPHTIANGIETNRLKGQLGKKIGFTDDGFWTPLGDDAPTTSATLTRSLGHAVLSRCGMEAAPYITVERLDKSQDTVAVCSSGITDFLGPPRVKSVLETMGDCDKAAEQLCIDAQSVSPGNDCTVIVVKTSPSISKSKNQHLTVYRKADDPREKKPSVKQRTRSSARRAKAVVSVDVPDRDTWTVKDAAWAWGLGSLHVKHPINLPKAKDSLAGQRAKRGDRKIKAKEKREQLQRALKAEDQRLKELESKLASVDVTNTKQKENGPILDVPSVSKSNPLLGIVEADDDYHLEDSNLVRTKDGSSTKEFEFSRKYSGNYGF